MNSTVYSILLCSLAVLVLSQELTEDSSQQMDKRARNFAFAKRFAFNSGPSRNFAFAKRSAIDVNGEDDSEIPNDSIAVAAADPMTEKRASSRFAFAKRFAFNNGPSRNFAFAKRSSYSSFA